MIPRTHTRTRTISQFTRPFTYIHNPTTTRRNVLVANSDDSIRPQSDEDGKNSPMNRLSAKLPKKYQIQQPFKLKDLFQSYSINHKGSGKRLWRSAIVMDDGSQSDNLCFSSVPYGDRGIDYIVDEDTGELWFWNKKTSEHAAAQAVLAAIDGIDEGGNLIGIEKKTNEESLRNDTRESLKGVEKSQSLEYTGVYKRYHDQIKKALRNINNERLNVVQAIRLCLRDDDEYFKKTIVLALGNDFDDELGKGENNLLVQQCRSLFRDSFTGFSKLLAEESPSLWRGYSDVLGMYHPTLDMFIDRHRDKLDPLSIPYNDIEAILADLIGSYNQLEYLLDLLSKTGLAHPSAAKSFKQNLENIDTLNNIEEMLKEKKQLAKIRKASWVEAQLEMKEREREFKMLQYESELAEVDQHYRDDLKAQQKETNGNFISTALSSVLSFFTLVPSSGRETIITDTTDRKVKDSRESKSTARKFRKEIGKFRNEVQLRFRAYKTVQTTLKKVTEMREDIKKNLCMEDFDIMEKNLLVAKDLLSQTHAAYFAQLHKNSIEQFSVINSRTNLTKPHDWFLRARLMERKIIFHGGPTNSG